MEAETEFIPSKPDYRVAAMNKKTEQKGNIGAAWTKKDGSIQVRLETFLALPIGPGGIDPRDLVITLFPNKQEEA